MFVYQYTPALLQYLVWTVLFGVSLGVSLGVGNGVGRDMAKWTRLSLHRWNARRRASRPTCRNCSGISRSNTSPSVQ